MANLNNDEDNLFQQYINLEACDTVQYTASSSPKGDTDMVNGSDPVLDALQSDFGRTSCLQDIDFPLDAQNGTVETQRMSQLSPMSRWAPATISTTASSVFRFRSIQPSSNMVPHISNASDLRSSKSAVDQAFELALQVVPDLSHSKASASDRGQNGYHQFKTRKQHPIQQSEERATKKLRLKRSEGRACMRCRFHKRRCGPGRPCMECVEKFLGQRDLAFKSCVRTNPQEFNPFLTDISADIEVHRGSPLAGIQRCYDHCEKQDHLDVTLYMWMFSELILWAERRSDSDQQIHKSMELKQSLRMLSSVTQNFLQLLESSLRRESSQIRRIWLDGPLVTVALFLYTFLKTLEAEHMLYGPLQAMDVCQRYTFEYIALFLPRTFKSKLPDIRICETVDVQQVTIPVSDLLECITQHAVEHGPRTHWQIRADVHSYGRELLKALDPRTKATLSEAYEDSDVQYESDTPQRLMKVYEDDWLSLSRDYPQLNNDCQLFGIWSLFWRNISIQATSMLDTSAFDFRSLAIFFLNRNNRTGAGPQLPRKTWKQWDKTAASFRYYLQDIVGLLLLNGQISDTDKDVLEHVYTMWLAPDVVLSKVPKPSVELKGAFRLFVAGSLRIHGLFEWDDFESFLAEVKSSGSNGQYARFWIGLPLYSEVIRSGKSRAAPRP